MKKVIGSVIVALTSSLALAQGAKKAEEPQKALAQEVKAVSSETKNEYAERASLLSGGSFTKEIAMGVLLGGETSDDLFLVSKRYMPLTNYLTSKTGKLVSFVPSKSLNTMSAGMDKKIFEVVYADTRIYSIDSLKDYTPVAKTTSSLQGTWLVKERSPIKEIEELKGTRIGMIRGKAETDLSMFYLAERKLDTQVTRIEGIELGVEGMITALERDSLDAVVLSLEQAREKVKSSGGKLRIVGVTDSVPTAMVFIKNGVPDAEKQSLVTALLSFSEKSNGAQFEPIQDKDLELAKRVSAAQGSAKK